MAAPLDFLYFDAAWTVVEPVRRVGEIYAGVAEEFGTRVEPGALDTAFGRAWMAAKATAPPGPVYGATHEEARRFWRRVVADAFATAGSAMPGDPFFDALYRRFATRECWRVPDDTLPALAAARARGVRVGILSNFDARLHAILDDVVLSSQFDAIVASCDAGCEKPDPAIFAHAMRRAGATDAARVGMIGDTPEDDFRGATAAGWRACLIDRKAGTAGSPVPRDGAPTFSNLVQCVEHLLSP